MPKVDQLVEITHRGFITRRGSPYLRRILFLSAKIASKQASAKFSREFKKLYHRKGKNKGKLCWIGIVRMLAEYIYTFLLRQEEYKEDSSLKNEKTLIMMSYNNSQFQKLLTIFATEDTQEYYQ